VLEESRQKASVQTYPQPFEGAKTPHHSRFEIGCRRGGKNLAKLLENKVQNKTLMKRGGEK
jgi:hypothetical protein